MIKMKIKFDEAEINVDDSVDWDEEGAFQDVLDRIMEDGDNFECESCETFFGNSKATDVDELPVCKECVSKAVIFLEKMTTIPTVTMTDKEIMNKYWGFL